MPRESEKPLRRQRLSAEENHEVVEPGLPDRRNHVPVEISRKIDPGDFGPQRAGNRAYLQGTGLHNPDPSRILRPPRRVRHCNHIRSRLWHSPPQRLSDGIGQPLQTIRLLQHEITLGG